MRTPAEHDRLHALRPLCHGGGQAAGLFALAQIEVFRLEDLATNRLRVGMLSQLIQAEVILTCLGQGHDVQVLADQHGVTVPGHLQLVDLTENAANGDIHPGDAFKKIAAVHRGNRRHHPALAGRVEVDVGPHHLAPRVVRGICLVVEVVVGNDHVMRVLVRCQEPGVNVVEAVPTIEVQAGHQRAALLELGHQRFQRRQLGHLAQVLTGERRNRRVEERRPPVVCRTVTHAAGGDGQLRRATGRLLQGTLGQVAVGVGEGFDLRQLTIDDACFQACRGLQILQSHLPQVIHLGIADRAVAQQVDSDQHRFYQHQRDQRTLHKGPPDPLTQAEGFFHRHAG